MNRRKFFDLLRIGGTAAAVAPLAVKAGEAVKVSDVVFTVEPGDKYLVGDNMWFATAMSSSVVKWSKVQDPETWDAD